MNIKKLLSLFLILCMLLATINVSADTAEDFEYTVTSGKITITGCNITDEHVEIPAEIDSKPVERIGENAFRGTSYITSVSIPDSVKAIMSGAFSNCWQLTEVSFSNQLQLISSGAFSGCSQLKKITIPDSVRQVGASAFSACTSLESVIIGGGVNAIAASTFANCHSLSKCLYSKKCQTDYARCFLSVQFA